jgi:hypothetical protein
VSSLIASSMRSRRPSPEVIPEPGEACEALLRPPLIVLQLLREYAGPVERAIRLRHSRGLGALILPELIPTLAIFLLSREFGRKLLNAM